MISTLVAILLAQAVPSPITSICPATGVMRRTKNGLIPGPDWRSEKLPSPPPGHPYAQSFTVWVEVLVDVSPTGEVKSARIIRSAGPSADARAMNVARISRYKPAMKDCRAVEALYHFLVPLAND